MWSEIATTGTKVKDTASINKANDKVKELHNKIKPDGAGIDVADWANDNVYFNRIFKQFEEDQTKADGSSTGEKTINKEGGEKSLRMILTEKLETGGDKKKLKEEVDHLMGKYFAENWEYADAANEGFIEVSRAPQFIHKIINSIKLDDEEEGLLWKSH